MSAFNLLSTSWIDRQGGVKTRRSGRRRILIAVPVLLVVLILSFPLYLTITGGGTLRRAYAHVTYEVMAHRASPVGKDPLQTVSGVMTYLHWRLNVPSDTPGRDRPPLDVAAEGRAYCNQIAVVHIQLVAKRGLSARIAMMRDKTGNSPHTIAEVNLNGRWIIVDPLNGILPGAERGGVTLDA